VLSSGRRCAPANPTEEAYGSSVAQGQGTCTPHRTAQDPPVCPPAHPTHPKTHAAIAIIQRFLYFPAAPPQNIAKTRAQSWHMALPRQYPCPPPGINVLKKISTARTHKGTFRKTPPDQRICSLQRCPDANLNIWEVLAIISSASKRTFSAVSEISWFMALGYCCLLYSSLWKPEIIAPDVQE